MPRSTPQAAQHEEREGSGTIKYLPEQHLMEHGNHQPKGEKDDRDASGEADDRDHSVHQMSVALSVHRAVCPHAQTPGIQNADKACYAYSGE